MSSWFPILNLQTVFWLSTRGAAKIVPNFGRHLCTLKATFIRSKYQIKWKTWQPLQHNAHIYIPAFHTETLQNMIFIDLLIEWHKNVQTWPIWPKQQVTHPISFGTNRGKAAAGGGVTATDTGQEASISYWNPKAPFGHMRNLWPTVGSFPRQLTTGSVCTGPHRRRLTPHNTTTTAASDWAALGPATGAGHGWRAVTRLSTKMTSASGTSGSTGGSRSKSRVVALR